MTDLLSFFSLYIISTFSAQNINSIAFYDVTNTLYLDNLMWTSVPNICFNDTRFQYI